jgi:nucleoside-diphosphate-sugar epimerase
VATTVLKRRPSGLGLAEVLADVADVAAVDEAVAGRAVVHLAAKVNVVGPWHTSPGPHWWHPRHSEQLPWVLA